MSKLFRHCIPAMAVGFVIAALSFIVPPVAQQAVNVFRMQNGTPSGASLSNSDFANGFYWGSGFTGVTKHVATATSTANTPSACTNCTLTTGSGDFAGSFTTSSTTAGITFGTAYTAAPNCLLQPAGTLAASSTGSATQPTFRVLVTGIHADIIANTQRYSYICVGVSGG